MFSFAMRSYRPLPPLMTWLFPFFPTHDVPGLHFAFSNRAGCPETVQLAGAPQAYRDRPRLLFMHVLSWPFCLSMAYGVLAFVEIFACLRRPLLMYLAAAVPQFSFRIRIFIRLSAAS